MAVAYAADDGLYLSLVARAPICGATQRGSYREIMIVGLVGPLIALTAAIVLGKLFGSF